MDSDIITAGSQQYRVAGWPQRVVARALDVALIIVGCSVGGVIAGAFVLPVGIVYLFIGSSLLKGASLGKRALGMKVIDARHGGPCSVVQDLLRQSYFFYGNPVFLAFIAYDAAKGSLDKPGTYVVHAAPLTAAEREVSNVVPPEKPAKLDLAGMGDALKKLRETRDLAAPREE